MASKTIKIIQHNVRHWSNLKNSLCNIYKDIDADIILINSHGLNTNQELKIFNYNIHKTNKTGEINDGVAIAIKRNIKYQLIDDFDQETLAVKVQTTLGTVVIATTYLPPRRRYLPATDFLKLINNNYPTYIIGDFNARHRIFGNADNNNVGNALQTIINSGKAIHLGPHFKTYIGNRSLTNPDKIFTNNKAFFNFYTQPGPLTPSDHTPIIFTISTGPIQIPVKPRFAMAKADWLGYQRDLNTHPVTESLDGQTLEDIDETLEKLEEAIKNAANKNIPKRAYRTLASNKPNETIKKIQTIYTNTLKYIEEHGISPELIYNLKVLQQNIQEICQNSAYEKWNNMIDNLNINKDSKDFWNTVNKLMGSTKQDIPYLLDQNGIKLYSDKEIEAAYRREWENVFRISDIENEEFDVDTEENVIDWMADNINRTIPDAIIDINKLTEIGHITKEEMLHHLRKFKEKTPGITGITRNMLINLPPTAITSLLAIFNASLASGYFPDTLKIAKLIFIPKPGKNPRQIQNHRPISLLEVHGKLYEKIINTRLLIFFENNNKFSDRQFGFRKNRSTQTAIAILTEIIAIEKAKGNQVNLVFRDVSKAFDKVWHLGLRFKLLQQGLPKPYEKLLCDYLEDRKAHISVGNLLGPAFSLHSGVPQGGCLSPTLYILYTSDMPNPSPYSEYIMYADDVTQWVSYSGKSTQMMAHHTANAIQNINNYERKWKIKTNTDKFKVLPIAKFKPAPLIVDGDIYNYANEGNFLGVKITTRGYQGFINEKIRKVKYTGTKLKRFQNLNSKNKRKLYMALQKSIIEYSPVPTCLQSKSTIKKLQILQNNALRFTYNIKYPDIERNESLHQKADLKPINIALHEGAKAIWNNIEDQHTVYEEWLQEDIEDNHAWFPRGKNIILNTNPTPRY